MSLFRHAVFEISVAKPQGSAASHRTGNRLCRPLECRQVVGHQYTGRPYASGLCFQDARPHAAHQSVSAEKRRRVGRPARLWLCRVPEKIRKQWQGLLEIYLTRRQETCRAGADHGRAPAAAGTGPADDQLVGPTGKPIHCLLTKADKLDREEQAKVLRDVRAEAADAGSPVTAQLFSSLKKTGMEEAEKIIAAWLATRQLLSGQSFFVSRKKEKPPAKGEKPGAECLNGVKAPAQGGEAGDGRKPSAT